MNKIRQIIYEMQCHFNSMNGGIAALKIQMIRTKKVSWFLRAASIDRSRNVASYLESGLLIQQAVNLEKYSMIFLYSFCTHLYTLKRKVQQQLQLRLLLLQLLLDNKINCGYLTIRYLINQKTRLLWQHSTWLLLG